MEHGPSLIGEKRRRDLMRIVPCVETWVVVDVGEDWWQQVKGCWNRERWTSEVTDRSVCWDVRHPVI